MTDCARPRPTCGRCGNYPSRNRREGHCELLGLASFDLFTPYRRDGRSRQWRPRYGRCKVQFLARSLDRCLAHLREAEEALR